LRGKKKNSSLNCGGENAKMPMKMKQTNRHKRNRQKRKKEWMDGIGRMIQTQFYLV
jgi:hypothetical protein